METPRIAVLAFGTPTRFGNVSSQLKQFLDTTSGLWLAGSLAGKPATGFTGSMDAHGGQESTLLALYHLDYDTIHAAGGNPYGVSQVDTQADNPDYVKAVLEAARFQGGRLAQAARALTPLQAL